MYKGRYRIARIASSAIEGGCQAFLFSMGIPVSVALVVAVIVVTVRSPRERKTIPHTDNPD